MSNPQLSRQRAALPVRRRHPVLTALVPLALVLVAIVTMVVVKTAGGSSNASASTAASGTHSPASSDGTSPLPAGVLKAVTSVTPATFAAVGAPASIASPVAVPGSILTGTDGKPETVYIGAEYCPFCAAERWAIVEALSRFGSFSGLQASHSSSVDAYPDTNTLSFYGSTYTSPYLDFKPVEERTNQVVGDTYGALQTPTAAEQHLLATYDVSPYTTQPGSIPFLDIGNRFVNIGASYTPEVLQGLSLGAIAAQLNNPHSLVATAIDGTANQITAAICAITGNQPASVCSSPVIAAMAKKLGA